MEDDDVAIAYSCAKNYSVRMRGILETDELASEAIIALAYAKETYDPSYHVPFCKYAYMIIYRHFIDLYRKHVRRTSASLLEDCFYAEDPLLQLVEDLEDISLFLLRLTPMQQALLLLRMQSYTQKECSKLLKTQFRMCGTQGTISLQLKKIGDVYRQFQLE